MLYGVYKDQIVVVDKSHDFKSIKETKAEGVKEIYIGEPSKELQTLWEEETKLDGRAMFNKHFRVV